MSLLDLKSDLSKFRSKTFKKDDSTNKVSPSADSYGDKFASYQPISSTLINKRPSINQPKNIDLVSKLEDTKLDDVIKESFNSMLINSVSEFSPKTIDYDFSLASNISLETISSNFSRIKTDTILSQIDKSNIVITNINQGTNNNESKIQIENNDSETGNIINPDTQINSIPLTYPRESQSVLINKDLLSPINNILNPDISLRTIELTTDKETQSVLISKDTKIKDIIVDPTSNKLLNDSILNLDGTPIGLSKNSKIELKKILQTVDTTKYNGQVSELAIADTALDLNGINKQILGGRHETDKNTTLSNKKDESVNYFNNDNATGFTKKINPFVSEYENNTSRLGFETLLETNYFDITNDYTKDGFTAFTEPLETKFKPNSSKFNWDGDGRNSPTVNYFDRSLINTNDGFHRFAQKYDTKYKVESSEFGWTGNRNDAPTNQSPFGYFDLSDPFKTTAGFHTFAQLYDTKYVPESSIYDWNGTATDSLENIIDVFPNANASGFTKFAQLFDTKYIPESSIYDWDGNPAASLQNVVDNFTNTNASGFTKFAQLFDTKYVPESSIYDWDGNPAASLQNVVDNFTNTNASGFTKFFQLYDTKYVPESSVYDWDGNPAASLQNIVDYFPNTNASGFNKFAQLFDTKYIEGSSNLDWDDTALNSMSNMVDYFPNTNASGFNKFAQLFDTKYVPESSVYDWDGNPAASLQNVVDYFPNTNASGFNKFAQLFDTKYVPESSIHDWDGNPAASLQNVVDYFPNTNASGFTKFPQLFNTEYVPASSIYDWDDTALNSMSNMVDYFPNTNASGFTKFPQLFNTEYVAESSIYDWDGNPASSLQNFVDYFPNTNASGFTKFPRLFNTEYVPASSVYDWDGTRSQAPSNQQPLGYFDLVPPFKTFRGFHTFAQPGEPTSFNTQTIGLVTTLPNSISNLTWDGVRTNAPTVNYFDTNNLNTSTGFHTFANTREITKYVQDSSQLDWDGTNILGVIPTRFFGFIPGETYGFMAKMSQFDGTTYPIINPVLPFARLTPEDLGFGLNQLSIRGGIKQMRIANEPLQTTNLEKYVPLTLGNKFISGFKATLDNQSPVVNVQKYGFNITGFRRRGKSVGQYVDITNNNLFAVNAQSKFVQNAITNRYTEGGSVNERPNYVDGAMELWANTGNISTSDQTFSATNNNLTAAQVVALNRSLNGMPVYNGKTYKSHIDYQYSKYNLVNDSYNTSTTFPQPFVDTSINGNDRDILLSLKVSNQANTKVTVFGQTFDFSSITNEFNNAIDFINNAQRFDEGLIRGGVIYHTIRTLLDTKRITKFLLSPKGLLWNVKQVGLQFMNPNVDVNPATGGFLGKPWTQFYNPLSVPLNILGKNVLIGTKFSRHGLLMNSPGKYEDATINRQKNSDYYQTFNNFSTPSSGNSTGDYNRLIGLTKELLPDSYKPIFEGKYASKQVGPDLPGELPKINTKKSIARLSNIFGGPDSTLGIFGTTINRASHPYKVVNSTGYYPIRQNILNGNDREIFFGGVQGGNGQYTLTSTDGKTAKYSDFLLRNTNDLGIPTFDGLIIGLKNFIMSRKGGSSDPRRAGSALEPGDFPYGIQKNTSDRLWWSMFDQFRHGSIQERAINTTDKRIRDIRSAQEMIHKNDPFKTTSPLQTYKTVDYGNLGGEIDNISDIQSSTTFTSKLKDFRSNIEGDDTRHLMSDSKIIDFKNLNLEDAFGVGRQGEPGSIRNEPYISTIQYSSLLPKGETNDGDRQKTDPNQPSTKTEKSNYKYGAYPTLKKELIDKYNTPITGKGTSVIKTIPKFRGDRINIIDWKRSTTDLSADYVYEKYKNGAQNAGDALGGAEDLIQFYFSSANLKGDELLNPTEAIVFRAYIDTIVDNHKPSWTPIKYMGRADPVYSYDGYERDINFGFTVHIGSRDEMKASWRKLNMLASWTAPHYTEYGFMKAPVVRLNIGNLYRKFPGFISNLSYTFDNTQTTWETAKLAEDQNLTDPYIKALTMPGVLELPKTINVQCTFVTFNMYRPEWDCVFYSLFDDSSGNGALETGLVPNDASRVNYFRTFDDLAIDHPMNSGLCALLPEKEARPKSEKKPKAKETVVEKETEKCMCPIVFCEDEDRYVTISSETGIQQLVKWMKEECPKVNIKIIGHASKGKTFKDTDKETQYANYNKRLSLSRAEAIKNILITEHGIEESRIQFTGVGYDDLIKGVPDNDPKQRRIEIQITNANGTTCKTKPVFSCKDNTGCTSSGNCKRVETGDESEFWLVGPLYYTTKYSVEPTGTHPGGKYEKVGDFWYAPNTGVTFWKDRYDVNANRVRGYSKTNNATSRYKQPTPPDKGFGTFLPAPPDS